MSGGGRDDSAVLGVRLLALAVGGECAVWAAQVIVDPQWMWWWQIPYRPCGFACPMGMHVGSMTFVRVWPGRVSLNAVALDLGSDVDANEI